MCGYGRKKKKSWILRNLIFQYPFVVCVMHTFTGILLESKENVFLVEGTNGKNIVVGIFFKLFIKKYIRQTVFN